MATPESGRLPWKTRAYGGKGAKLQSPACCGKSLNGRKFKEANRGHPNVGRKVTTIRSRYVYAGGGNILDRAEAGVTTGESSAEGNGQG